MAQDSHKCPNCGATISEPGARHCSYCGAALPRAEARPAGPPSHAVRFEALRAHQSYAGLLARTPSTTSHLVQFGCVAAFLVLFIGVALFMFAAISGPGEGAPGVFKLFPLLFVGFGIFGLVKVMNRAGRFASAPLDRRPARVLDERTEVSGGGRNRRSRTSYYVTLELEDGTRRELQTTGKVIGLVTRDDLGIAYLKADTLLDFQRVPV